MAVKGDHTTLINISRGLPILSVSSKATIGTLTGTPMIESLHKV